MAQDEKSQVADAPPDHVVSIWLVALLLFAGYMATAAVWDCHHLRSVPVEISIGCPVSGVGADGRVKIQGKTRTVVEGEALNLPANRFLILIPDIHGAVDVEVSNRRICNIQAVGGGKCVITPLRTGQVHVTVRRRVLLDTWTVAKTKFTFDVVEPECNSNDWYLDISIGFLRGFYEAGEMWMSGEGMGFLNVKDPKVNVDVGELVMFAPADVDWQTGHCTMNPTGYTLKAVVLDPGCIAVEGSAVIAKRPGSFRVKLTVTVPKGYSQPAPIVVRIDCSGKRYEPGRKYKDDDERSRPGPDGMAGAVTNA